MVYFKQGCKATSVYINNSTLSLNTYYIEWIYIEKYTPKWACKKQTATWLNKDYMLHPPFAFLGYFELKIQTVVITLSSNLRHQ